MTSHRNRFHTLSSILLAAGTASVAGAQNCDPADVFPQPPSYELGTNPSDIVLVDLNGDGSADLVSSNAVSDDVSVLLNNGDGTFAAQTTYACGNSPSSVAAGDFDGDGNTDLIVTNNNGSDLSILLGNGDGTFAPESRVPTLPAPNDVATGDFNGDGFDDLAVALPTQFTLSVFLSNGDGAFGSSTDYVLDSFFGGNVIDVHVVDFDADGSLDILYSYFYSFPKGDGAGGIGIRKGNGDGTFTDAPGLSINAPIRGFAIGDLDADGDLDLAAGHSTPFNFFTEAGLTVALNLGSFSFSSEIQPGWGPSHVDIADMDGDGISDVLTISSDDQAMVFGGNGSEILNKPTGYDINGLVRIARAADLNSDSQTDAVFVVGNKAFVSVSQTASALELMPQLYYGFIPESRPLSVEIADINNDGSLDVLPGGTNGAEPIGFGSLLRNDGDGSLSYSGSPTGARKAAGDVDNDGNIDIITSFLSLDLHIGNGTGGFNFETTLSTSSNIRLHTLADFNGDGNLDLVAHDQGQQQLLVWLGDGSGGFATSPSLPLGGTAVALTAVDLSDDGRVDLAATVSNSTVAVFVANADGTFTSGTPIASGTPLTDIAAADTNGDGHTDLIVGGTQQVLTLLGNGDGSFAPAVTTAMPSTPTSISAGDWSGDGVPDLLLARADGATVSIAHGNGDGTYGQPTRIASLDTSIRSDDTALVDLNGDGLLDAVYSEEGKGSIGVHLNACTTTPNCPGDVTGDNEVDLADLNLVLANFGQTTSEGDANGDGEVDLADLNVVLAAFGTGCD